MKISRLKLYKMVGAGNDFLFVNLLDSKAKKELGKLEKKSSRSELAKKLCRREESIGADGLIFIEKADRPLDFKWDFYNSDGSIAEMCGNASRCAVRFANEVLNIKKKSIRFLSLSGQVSGERIGVERARVFLAAPKLLHEGLEVIVESKKWVGSFLNSGVPHFVVEAKFKGVKDLNKASAKKLQDHKIFGKAKTNVTFIEVLKKNRIRAATFERGVCDFTKACGTGAIAAAFVHSEKTKSDDFIFVEMPGGELKVRFDNAARACLEGEALMLAEVFISKECLYANGKSI